MVTTIEFGVNEMMPGGAGHNPFDNNFDTEQEAVAEGTAYLKANPNVAQVVIFKLTLEDDKIASDTPLHTITRDALKEPSMWDTFMPWGLNRSPMPI